jgi:hypothetical protein
MPTTTVVVAAARASVDPSITIITITTWVAELRWKAVAAALRLRAAAAAPRLRPRHLPAVLRPRRVALRLRPALRLLPAALLAPVPMLLLRRVPATLRPLRLLRRKSRLRRSRRPSLIRCEAARNLQRPAANSGKTETGSFVILRTSPFFYRRPFRRAGKPFA